MRSYKLVLIATLLLLVSASTIIMVVPKHQVNAIRFISRTYNYVYYHAQNLLFNTKIPASYIEPDKLKYKVNNPAAWMLEQINADFSSYPNASKEHVLATYNNFAAKNAVVHCTIKDKQCLCKVKSTTLNGSSKHGYNIFQTLFNYIAKQGYVTDIEFLYRLTDFYTTIPDNNGIESFAPVLTVAKDTSRPIEKNLVLVPDYMNLESWYKLKPRINKANNIYKWHNKDSKIFWRGGEADVSGYRHKIVDYAKSGTGNFLLDAKFVTAADEFVSPENHLKYKFQLNIDGHTAAWERLVWQLQSNSVSIKQASPLQQWYYNAIKPNIHYIEADNNPAHLPATISQYTDLQLQQIAKNATEFAENNLSFNDMLSYWILALQKYELLQHQST